MNLPSQPFSFQVPTHVRFGDGVLGELPDHIPRGLTRVALVRGASGVASHAALSLLKSRGLEVVDSVCAGEPTVDDINSATRVLRDARVEAIIACGGGAVLDTGKAIAYCLGADRWLDDDFDNASAPVARNADQPVCIAIPTTAGTGAEVTANAVLGVPSRRAKISLRGPSLQPALALVDPELLPSAPRSVILASGLDAVVQTIEAYTSSFATPFSDALTQPNVARGLHALRAVLDTGARDAWRALSWVSLCSGVALANSGLGAAHGLASVLGGRCAMPHGALCGLFLAPVMRQNLRRAAKGSEAAKRLETCAQVISDTFPPTMAGDPFSGLVDWQMRNGQPRLSLARFSTAELQDVAICAASASSSRKNAVELLPADFLQILRHTLGS